MMQKQDQQRFYTKKLVMLCMFLFLSFATPESQGAEYNTRQAEATRMEEQREVSRKIRLIYRNEIVQPTSEDLQRLYEVLSVRSREDLVKEHQVFQLEKKDDKDDDEYEQKLGVTNEYRLIPGNTESVERIEQKLELEKYCPICLQMFTHSECNEEGQIFVSGCNDKIPHILHYNCYLELNNKEECPCCLRYLVSPNVEEILENQQPREMTITEVFNTRNINHLEKISDSPSHWKLHIRDKTKDEEITRTTQTAAKRWVIVDEEVSESIEVLEIPLDKPQDLEKYHGDLLELLNFQKIKFNNDQEPKEIFLVTGNTRCIELQYKNDVVFDVGTKKDGVHQIELRREKTGTKGNQISYIQQRGKFFFRKIFSFNKENIDYLKETKSIFLFVSDVSIGLQGDAIIPKEDIENIFITIGKVELLCDNVNNFSVMKSARYTLLSPIDQLKIAQINEMKNNLKLPIKGKSVFLTEEDCFLFPLFELSSETRNLSFWITRSMVEKVSFPFKDIVKELKEPFTGVEIKGRALEVAFQDYAIVLLFGFSEDALEVEAISIGIFDYIENGELNIIKNIINNQPISKQPVETLILKGELFDFAVETKITESIKSKFLSVSTAKKNINDDFICKEDGRLSITTRGLAKLLLLGYAIKYLLYFKKGANELNALHIDCSALSENETTHQWLLGVLERAEDNKILFNIPFEDSLVIIGWWKEEIETNIRRKLIAPYKLG